MNAFVMIRSLLGVVSFSVSLLIFESALLVNHAFSNSAFSKSGNCLTWNAETINKKSHPFESYIDQYARKYGVDKNLIKSVIAAESCFQVKAESHKGAQGLMQLIPATAERFGVSNRFLPQQNISGGTKYLSFLMNRFDNDLPKVIASYNAGEGAVDRYKGIPPYEETKQYVKNVFRVYKTLNPSVSEEYMPIFKPDSIGHKAGRQGWEYNKTLAPHLYKQ